MSLFFFIDQAVRQIGSKQAEAFEEFSEGIINLELPEKCQNSDNDGAVSACTVIAEGSQKQSHDDDTESDEEIRAQQKDLSVVEKIVNKNSRALDDFFNKMEKLTVEFEPTPFSIIEPTTLTIIEPATLSTSKANPQISDKSVSKADKQALPIQRQKIPSLSQQYQKSAEYCKTLEVETTKSKIAYYRESLQLYQKNDLHQNPENLQSPQDNSQTASQILAQLEQIHRQKSIQGISGKLGRSLNKRTRIVKMSSHMQDMMKQRKQKEAEERIKVNIEFLQSIKAKPSKHESKFKEFNNFTPQNADKLKQSIRIKTIKKANMLKNHHEDIEEKTDGYNFSKINSNRSNIFVDSRLRLPQIEPRKGAIRPRPYSIYNVTSKGNQMFIHK